MYIYVEQRNMRILFIQKEKPQINSTEDLFLSSLQVDLLNPLLYEPSCCSRGDWLTHTCRINRKLNQRFKEWWEYFIIFKGLC